MSLQQTEPVATAPQTKPTVFRGDIQGLRAIAVGIVVLYHFWPTALPGGFVGVDVFFVISGFLITTHLIKRPPKNLRDVTHFWMRRVKRLLPASFLVILSALVGVWLLAPITLWQDWGFQALAATFYFQNWYLATSKVDYLAEADSPSPFQHFWSLSGEEQFYLVWPILIGVLMVSAVRLKWNRRKVVLTGVGLIFALSLGYSIYATANDAGTAYFSTFTRAWEFAAGALVATLGERAYAAKNNIVSLLAAWVGLAAIVFSALSFDGEMPFPGYIALLPVLGTALLLLAHSTHKWSPNKLLANRLMSFFGDNSYAIYLWHWPILILAPYTVAEFGLAAQLGALALTLVLSVLTQKLVEVRFRKFIEVSKRFSAPRFLVVGSATLAVAAGAFYSMSGAIMEESKDITASAKRVSAQVGVDCFAANGLSDECVAKKGIPERYQQLAPAPIVAKEDKPDIYKDDCFSGQGDKYSERPVCSYGEGKIKVAVVGNSHAGQWMPALKSIAEKRGWELDTYLISRCAVMGEPQEYDEQASIDGCTDYAGWVTGEIEKNDYDLVISSSRQSLPIVGHDLESSEAPAKEAFEKTLRDWEATGAQVAVIRDTPFPGSTLGNLPDCVAENEQSLSECSGAASEWIPMDPQADAVESLQNPNIVSVSMNDKFCREDKCHGVVGGVIAYWDHSHLSQTMAENLAEPLNSRLASALNNDKLFATSQQ
ncbi:acyltransferase family protein [Glutamicibacter arilaitensis]|uniref:acyltransferase family protein n=1 Tax=Glutamicibacter arilaitensis TaxID=256701 RepID=UPI00384B8817